MIKKFLTLIGLFSLVVIVGVGLQVFKVKQINCQTTEHTQCEPNLQTELENQLKDRSLFFTNFTQLLTAEPFASQPYTLNTYQKKLPSTIMVTFQKEPLQYLLETKDGQTLAVGTQGSIIPTEQPPEETPVITIAETNDNLANNQQLDPRFHQPLSSLISSLYKQQINFDNIVWESQQKITVQSNNQTIILNATNPALAVKKLRLLQQSEEVDGIAEPIREIDLRFELPVLRTSQ